MFPRAPSVCAATCSCLYASARTSWLKLLAGALAMRQTFVGNQRKWRAVDLLHSFLNFSRLDVERPDELIISQDG